MTASSTFGFECEMETGAQELTVSLYGEDHEQLIGVDHLHGYHCDCPSCVFNPSRRQPFDLRAQTDSSCSGELISRVFASMVEARPVMEKIQEHAILVDAIPGFSAGFHVHVGMSSMGRRERAPMFFEFLRFEPLLTFLATGRWVQLRENNASVRQTLAYTLADTANFRRSDYNDMTERQISECLNTIRNGMDFAYSRENLLEVHVHNDRHSNLAVRTRHETWEFRIFNSTRSAWRMELWCGLARAMVDPVFSSLLSGIENPAPTTDTLEAFVQALSDSGNSETAELAARQIGYRATKAQRVAPDFESLVAV